ncbi:MAG: flavin reductase family protein [Bacteroidota bacterium]
MTPTILEKMTYGHYIVTAIKSGDELKTREKDYIAAGTVNWVSQVSFEPAMFAIAIGLKSDLNETIDYSEHFTIHILSDEEQDWVEKFGANSTIKDGKINGISFQKQDNALILPNSIGYFTCKVEKSMNNGDHTLHIGKVVDQKLHEAAMRPLCTNQLKIKYKLELADV